MIRLLFNYYEDKAPARKKEIDFCLQKNLENPYLNVIVLESFEKPQYRAMFEKLNQLTSPDDINIICNSDIFFDDTILIAAQRLSNRTQRGQELGEVLALSRWDYLNSQQTKLFERHDSQDTWIWKGYMQNVIGNFTLGRRGCDNRIAFEIKDAGYIINNPSRTIKTYHVHNSNVRNYSHTDAVPGPYLHVPITS